MKYCPKCNIDYPSDKKFCRQCGTALIDKPAQDSAQPTAPETPITPSQTTPGQTTPGPVKPPKAPPPRTSGWNMLRAVAVILACVLVGMALPIGGFGPLLGLVIGGATATHFFLRDK